LENINLTNIIIVQISHMKLRTLLVLSLVTLFIACSSEKDKSAAEIKAMETADTALYSKANTEKLVVAYQDFIDKYPDDPHTPEYTFMAGNRLSMLDRNRESIDMLNRYYTKYPDGAKADVALFTMAFIYDSKLQDFQKAKETYELLISKYPNSKYVENSRQAIPQLGKTPEEIMQGFLKKDSLNGVQ
jgi:outer membrane protein assembly factor BamD (BamD/ComL family)